MIGPPATAMAGVPPPPGPFLPSPEAVPQETKSLLGWAALGCQRLLSLALILESVTERGGGRGQRLVAWAWVFLPFACTWSCHGC